MLFINRYTWGHVLEDAAHLLHVPREGLLTPEELATLDGKTSPET